MASGARNAKWKGGTMVNDDGYLRITAGPLRGTYVHRLVLAALMAPREVSCPDCGCTFTNGRELGEGEEAHHDDEDRLNPHWTNLKLKVSGEHQKEHAQRRRERRTAKPVPQPKRKGKGASA